MSAHHITGTGRPARSNRRPGKLINMKNARRITRQSIDIRHLSYGFSRQIIPVEAMAVASAASRAMPLAGA